MAVDTSGEWQVSIRGTLPKLGSANSMINQGRQIAADPDTTIVAIVTLAVSSLEESHDEETPSKAKMKIIDLEEVLALDRKIVLEIAGKAKDRRLAVARPLFQQDGELRFGSSGEILLRREDGTMVTEDGEIIDDDF